MVLFFQKSQKIQVEFELEKIRFWSPGILGSLVLGCSPVMNCYDFSVATSSHGVTTSSSLWPLQLFHYFSSCSCWLLFDDVYLLIENDQGSFFNPGLGVSSKSSGVSPLLVILVKWHFAFWVVEYGAFLGNQKHFPFSC